ncbi:MAG: tetratricopeptide repeat protein [Saprospiraceae bacterium]|nr:tetratricopeptide repeat protein [Saprospiraceae bacterium]
MPNQIVLDLAGALRKMNIEESMVKRASSLGINTEAIIDWIDLASDLRSMDKPYACLLVYETSEKIFPNDRFLWNNRGVLLRSWERYEDAIRCFKRALEIDPTYVRPKEGIAECFKRMHDFPNARNAYKDLFSCTQGSPQAWNNYAECLKWSEDYEGAIDAFKKSISLDSNYTEPLYNLAGLLNEMKHFKEALEIIDQLISIEPHDNQSVSLREEILKASANSIKFQSLPVHIPRKVIRIGRSQSSIEALYKLVETGIQHIPVPANLPPVVFISYRWSTTEEDNWVAKFANDLKARGYDVVFDRNIQSERSEPLPVHELVALMLKCNWFVPILTEPYRRRVDIGIKATSVEEDGWVFDEYQVALKLGQMNRLAFKGIWRSGPVVPLPFQIDSVCDFRNDYDYETEMNRAFSRCMATITGITKAGREFTTDPIERILVQELGRQLENTGKFDRFLISYWMA